MTAPYDLVLRAKAYIDPLQFERSHDRAVCIRGNTVSAVLPIDHPRAVGERDVDLGDSVLLPGFVNCHTHLDLSHLRGQPLDGSDFGAWLSGVLAARGAPRDVVLTALDSTLAEMIATGTCSVMDVLAAHPHTMSVARGIVASGLAAAIAVEVLCPDPDAEDAAFAAAVGTVASIQDMILEMLAEDAACYLERIIEGPRLPCVGLSPHAPYTVSPRLYRRLAAYAERHLLPQTTHLSEATSEREFLAHGTGPLMQLFKSFGADVSKMRWTDKPAVETWLAAAANDGAPGTRDMLLVHCYDLLDHEVRRLGAARATVVYCPRSRDFFGHPPFRWRDLADNGVSICIGTDSLGSNLNLDLLQELAYARAEQPNVRALELWRAATTNGRKALAPPSRRGDGWLSSIADLQAIRLPSGSFSSTEDLLEALLTERPACLATVIRGKLAYLRA